MSFKMNSELCFIIGAPKCGTSALAAYLDENPRICVSKPKEPHFFNIDSLYSKGINFYLNYYFRHAKPNDVLVDATPLGMLKKEIVVQRILDSLSFGTPKFIALLRDPVERAWSHYLHEKTRNGLTESFEYLIFNELENKNKAVGSLGLIKGGMYGEQLQYWFDVFGKERFLVLFSEHLNISPNSIVHRCEKFLGVPPNMNINTSVRHNVAAEPRLRVLRDLIATDNAARRLFRNIVAQQHRLHLRYLLEKYNVRPYTEKTKPTMNGEIKELLRSTFKNDICVLEDLLGCDLSDWKS